MRVHRAGLEVLADHVEARHQAFEELAALGLLQVDRDALLAEVVAQIGGADAAPVVVVEGGQRAASRVAGDRGLDLDDLGAEVREPTRVESGPPVHFRPLELGLGAWMLALAYFGYSIGTEGYLTFTPDLLVGRGYELARASSIVGSYALLALVLKPILSSFLRPTTAIPFVVVATGFALASVGLLFLSGTSPLVSSGAMGVSLAFGMPALFALPTFLLGAERSGQGYGLYQLFYSLGFFAQPLVGLVADRSGGYGAGYVVVAGYCLLGLLVIVPTVRRLRPEGAS